MSKTPVTNTYWKSGFCPPETQASSITRVVGEHKSLLLSGIMFNFEVNCTAWKIGGLGESGWDPPRILVL